MGISIKQTISATYSEEEIKRLIVSDLVKKGVNVTPKDIKVSISGGYLDDTWKQYSGGGGPGTYGSEVVPVKFNGFVVHREN